MAHWMREAEERGYEIGFFSETIELAVAAAIGSHAAAAAPALTRARRPTPSGSCTRSPCRGQRPAAGPGRRQRTPESARGALRADRPSRIRRRPRRRRGGGAVWPARHRRRATPRPGRPHSLRRSALGRRDTGPAGGGHRDRPGPRRATDRHPWSSFQPPTIRSCAPPGPRSPPSRMPWRTTGAERRAPLRLGLAGGTVRLTPRVPAGRPPCWATPRTTPVCCWPSVWSRWLPAPWPSTAATSRRDSVRGAAL
jgi:hypothetical protein